MYNFNLTICSGYKGDIPPNEDSSISVPLSFYVDAPEDFI